MQAESGLTFTSGLPDKEPAGWGYSHMDIAGGWIGSLGLIMALMLAGLRGMANALILQTDLLGEIAVCQLSGSLTQTAYALVSDLVTIRRRQSPAPHAVSPGRSQ